MIDPRSIDNNDDEVRIVLIPIFNFYEESIDFIHLTWKYFGFRDSLYQHWLPEAESIFIFCCGVLSFMVQVHGVSVRVLPFLLRTHWIGFTGYTH